MKKTIFIFLAVLCTEMLSAGDLQITQIDTGRLLFNGVLDIYLTTGTAAADSLSVKDLSVSEKSAGALDIEELTGKANSKTGIEFILLIDNSGSMYDESYQGSSRINQAEIALSTFLDNIDPLLDTAAVYSFNSRLERIAAPGTPVPEIRRRLSLIERPAADMAFTELYNSLGDIPRLFQRGAGRKAAIVLSDGENYSLFEKTDKESPYWNSRVNTPYDVINAFLEAGITLDGINLSGTMDSNLERICTASGGMFHDVRSTADISGVYSNIRNRITNEYRLTVKAPAFRQSSGELTVRLGDAEDSRIFLAPVLFGGGNPLPLILGFALLAAAAGVIFIMYRIPYDRPSKSPQLQALGSSEKTLIRSDNTVIGSGRDADLTLAGSPGIEESHATIIYDEKTEDYTLVSRRPVLVNNRKTVKKTLSPGDVITIEGSTMVFDKPE